MTVLAKESLMRWDKLEALRAAYPTFEPFLIDVMEDLMGFRCTDIQIDIGDFLQYGPQYLMVQAQRSQAKSSIVAIYAVWCLIHDTKYRIVIVSAGSSVATEIANWVIQIIMNWSILECMRPDRNHGDRSSSEKFDIHWQLKGPGKSPSVACLGVTANMQGIRADLLVPDDIESSKNGATEIQRQQLIHLSKDFTSICQLGRIAYMGTPQTVDSIYNALPGRGYTIRIWPGRYPTKLQLPNYGDHLAPLIRDRLIADPSLGMGGGPLGDQGRPVDPVLLPEDALTSKEMDQGAAYFQLQHMLNTRLADEERFPLKSKDLITMSLNDDSAPGQINWMPSPDKRVKVPSHPDGVELYRPFNTSEELYKYEGRSMYIDTAGGGQNGDETSCTVTYFLHGYVFVKKQLNLPGGYADEVFDQVAQLALDHKIQIIEVEKNYGNGAFAQMLRPVLLKLYKKEGHNHAPHVEDIQESGQKELRIIDTLGPLLGRHRIIIDEQVWHDDIAQVQQYPIDSRTVYTLWNQFTKVCRDRGALVHDDRLDSLAGACRRWVAQIAVDEQKRMGQKQTNEAVAFMNDWQDGSPEERAALNTKSSRPAGIVRSNALNRTRRHGKSRLRKPSLPKPAGLPFGNIR